MNICGGTFSWPEVTAASGEAFRFAYDYHWAQDAEYVSDANLVAQILRILGILLCRVIR